MGESKEAILFKILNTFCGPKPVVNNSSSYFVRTVIDFGASSHLALSSHFLREPVKMRRGTNVNRGRFHRTMGDSRTIRLNVETATQSVPRWCMQIFGKAIQHSNTSKNWPILRGSHLLRVINFMVINVIIENWPSLIDRGNLVEKYNIKYLSCLVIKHFPKYIRYQAQVTLDLVVCMLSLWSIHRCHLAKTVSMII